MWLLLLASFPVATLPLGLLFFFFLDSFVWLLAARRGAAAKVGQLANPERLAGALQRTDRCLLGSHRGPVHFPPSAAAASCAAVFTLHSAGGPALSSLALPTSHTTPSSRIDTSRHRVQYHPVLLKTLIVLVCPTPPPIHLVGLALREGEI